MNPKLKKSAMFHLYTRDVLLATRKVKDVALGLLFKNNSPVYKTLSTQPHFKSGRFEK